MNLLELTAYIPEPEGYADLPDFESDVWPLLRRKGQEIENLFLFINDNSRSLAWPGHFELVTRNILRIRSMDELTDRELDRLQVLSFYGGHLNVVYRVPAESSLLLELCSMYPLVKLSSDDIDPLGLNQQSLSELGAFTAALPKELLHFSFSHDADPLYVFGDLETLRDLLRRYYQARREHRN